MGAGETSVLALDAGQSGTRARLVTAEGAREAAAGGVQLVVDDASAARTVDVVGGLVAGLGRPRCAVTVLGTTAFSPDPRLNARLAAGIAGVTGSRRVVLAVDSVTSHLGALGDRPGVVAAVGTGVTVCMRDGDAWLGWLDGHGSVLGDRGGGYRIGLAGLRSAARSYDLGDVSTLLRRGEERFGPVRGWAFVLRGASATARIASFAVDVLACASSGERAAVEIRDAAAGELADTVAAAVRRLSRGVDGVAVSWTGSVLSDAGLREEFLRRLADLSPNARPRPPVGTALDGAICLARDPRPAPVPGLVEVHERAAS